MRLDFSLFNALVWVKSEIGNKGVCQEINLGYLNTDVLDLMRNIDPLPRERCVHVRLPLTEPPDQARTAPNE